MTAPHVKRLRTSMTDAERKLWRALRARNIGPKFRRQVPLGPFIVDFVCFDAKIIVEVDGSQHADNPRDAARDRYFTERGYRVLRFWNSDVLRDLNSVLQKIYEETNPSPGASASASLRRDAPPSPSRACAWARASAARVGEGIRVRGTG
jgi:very-short-patch-repair endonuclease